MRNATWAVLCTAAGLAMLGAGLWQVLGIGGALIGGGVLVSGVGVLLWLGQGRGR